MTRSWWSRAILTLVVVSGLLAPVWPASADDDDERLKIQIRDFRCYMVLGGTLASQFVRYPGPPYSTVYAGFVNMGRELNSQGERKISSGTFEQEVPYIYYEVEQHPEWFSRLRNTVAGVDSVYASTADDSAEAECDQLAGRSQSFKVNLHLICGVSEGQVKAIAVADLINAMSQQTRITGSLRLFGRRGGGDFQELTSQNIAQTLTDYSVEFEDVQFGEAGLRRVRAEAQVQVMGSNEQIREREEADCQNGD